MSGLTVLWTRWVPTSSVRIPAASMEGRRWLGWPGLRPGDANSAIDGGPSPYRGVPLNSELSLPFVVAEGPLRVSIRARTDVRCALSVRLGRVRVGEILIPPGEWGRYGLEVPSPPVGGALHLALALQARPLVRRALATEPTLLVADLDIESRRLVLRPSAALLVGSLPLVAFVLGSLIRLSPRHSAMAALVVAVACALAGHTVPLRLILVGPPLLGTAILASIAVRLRLPGRLKALCATTLRGLDRFLVGTRPSPVEDAVRVTAANVASTAAVAATPGLVTCFLIATLFGRTLLDYVPGFLNDAVDYWIEIQAFAHAGFGAGYFTVDERPAAASFSHFGSHGPLFPMIYGSLGRVLGWHPYSAPLLHMGFVTAALAFFVHRTRLDGRQRLLAILCLATFWPLLLFLPTNMQEAFHAAMATALVVPFRAFLDRGSLTRALRAFAFSILLLAALMRPSWGLLFAPCLLLMGARSRRGQLLSLAGALALLLATAFAFALMAAPFAGASLFIRALTLREGVASLWDHAAANLRRAVFGGTLLELQGRALVLGMLVACTAALIASREAAIRREAAFHAYNLGVPLLALILVYPIGNWAGYRILGVHVLLTTLLLVASRQPVLRRMALIVVLLDLISLGPFLHAFRDMGTESFSYDPQRIQAFGETARRALTFHSGRDAWCNTLDSMSYPFFFPEMVGLPPGIGVTMIFPRRGSEVPASTVKAKYVLLDPEPHEHRFWSRGPVTLTSLGPDHVHANVGDWISLNLRPLAESTLGGLYRNLDARCPED